jgi:hypothetical protein
LPSQWPRACPIWPPTNNANIGAKPGSLT